MYPGGGREAAKTEAIFHGFQWLADFYTVHMCPVMGNLIKTAEKYSYADSNILIHGETERKGRAVCMSILQSAAPGARTPLLYEG